MTSTDSNSAATISGTNGLGAHRVVEMYTGMHYWDGQKWAPSDPSFATADDGFTANRTQHKVHLTPDINVTGAVSVTTRDGVTLNSTPIGIGLYDAASGNFSLIATLTNSTGVLVDSNKVIYPDAFAGVCANVVYTMKRGSFHQDVVLTGQLDPAAYGFPADTTRIQVVTEFFNTPEPQRKSQVLRKETNPSRRQSMVSPDLTDEVLGFGEFVLGLGKAFAANMPTNSNPHSPVGKQFTTTADNRRFLIETVEYGSIQHELQTLPPCNPSSTGTNAKLKKVKADIGYAAIPKPPASATLKPALHALQSKSPIQFAAIPGVVIDYVGSIGGTIDDDVVFAGDTTYVVSGPVFCNGHATFEGGAVFKFPVSYSLSSSGLDNTTIQLNNSFDIVASGYHPVIFTAVDDDSVGVPISSGSLFGNWYGNPDLTINCPVTASLSNLRFCYAYEAICFSYVSDSVTIAHSQIINSLLAIEMQNISSTSVVTLNNCLVANVPFPFIESWFNTYNITHCTFDNVSQFIYGSDSTSWDELAIDNSIFSNDGDDWSSYLLRGAFNGFWNSESFGDNPRIADQYPFQSAAFGNYYLSDYAIHQNFFVSWAQIDPGLAAEMANKTTTAPLELPPELDLFQPLTLMAQTVRYSDPSLGGTQHIGFHYEALDYIVADVWLQPGAILNVLPGTAIAVRDDCWFGFTANFGSAIHAQGMADRPIIFTETAFVQEQPANPWGRWIADPGLLFPLILFNPMESGLDWPHHATFPGDVLTDNPPSEMDFRFARCYMAAENLHFAAGIEAGIEFSITSSCNLSLRDCEFHSGGIILAGWWYPGQCQVSWNNNLFDRTAIVLDPSFRNEDWSDGQIADQDMSFAAYNNLFRGGLLDIWPVPASAGAWIFKDNLLDEAPIAQNSIVSEFMDYNYNGWWPLSGDLLAWWQSNFGYGAAFPYPSPAHGPNDVVLTVAPPYQTGPYGNYYLPNTTLLFGAGSRAPADAGLYHYTTRLDQTKEGSESAGHQVNIGLHYIANSIWGHPADTDLDGIPDYVENWHGDGAYANHTDNETDWQNAHTIAGIFDPTNAVYDDIDLSGNGIIGRIKKALCISALDPTNPLTFTEVITGQEPNIVTFEVPISYAILTNIATLNININGADVTIEAFTNATDGNTLLTWNAAFDPPGQHYLQLQLTPFSSSDNLASQPGFGVLSPFYSSNMLQFFESDTMFDDTGAFLDAKLAELNATYTIQLLDKTIIPPTPIKTITGSTANGMIQEDWDLSCDLGTNLFAGSDVVAVYNVNFSDGKSGIGTKDLSKLTSNEQGNNFDFTYFYTPTNGSMTSVFGQNGEIWDGLQAVVDTLIMPVTSSGGFDEHYDSYINRYTGQPYGGSDGYPGYINSQTDVSGILLPDLANRVTRNFFCYAHGANGALASYDGSVYLLAWQVAAKLTNLFYPTRGGLITKNPYRFVFLDGCSTASGKDWRRAFGIFPLDAPNQAGRNKVGQQAYVGWATKSVGWFNGNGNLGHSIDAAESYAQTLNNFYDDWMNHLSLAVCIQNAANPTDGTAPFPVSKGANTMENYHIFGYNYNDVYYDYIFQNELTSKIYVVGHSGLTRNGIDISHDNQYPAPATIE